MDNTEEVLTASNTYSLSNIIRHRDVLRNIIAGRHTKVPMKFHNLLPKSSVIGESTEDIVNALVPSFTEIIGTNEGVMEQSLHSLLDRADEDGYPSLSDLNKAAWIIAGNYKKLRLEVPVEPFIAPTTKEWVPLYIIDQERDIKGAASGFNLTFIAFGGSPTSEKLKEFFRHDAGGSALGFLRFALGVPVTTRNFSFEDAPGMYVWALIDPAKSNQYYTRFSRMECNNSFKAKNRKLLSARKEDCIHGIDDFLCTDCAHGLDSCWRATHAKSYEVNFCKVCRKSAYFRPGGTRCVSCETREKINRKFKKKG